MATISENGGRVVHHVQIALPEEYIVDSEGNNIDDLVDDVISSEEAISFV